MKRKQVRFWSVLLVLTMLMGICMPASAAESTARFSDVPEGHWADGVIHQLRSLGLSEGVGDNAFGLGQTITRGEFLAFIVKVMGWEEVVPQTASYTDVEQSAWYYPAVETAALHGVMPAGGTIRAGEPITREEMAMWLVGALGFWDLGSQLKNTACAFSDVTDNKGYIALASDLGLVGGMGDGTFAPQATATREQAAAMIVRLYETRFKQMKELHGCYAISSSAQSQLMGQMDSVSFGWSRLTLDNGQVVLNTTSKNNNEFRVPTGFTEPVALARANGASAQLMVYADNASATEAGPLLTAVLTDSTRRAQAVEAIVTQVNQTVKDGESISFDGVVIDFEAMKGEELKSAFNTFLRELKSQLGAKSLYVTVHPMRDDQAYYDAYDYQTIGQLADKVILMASDYYAKSLTQAEMDMGYTMTPLSPLNEVYYGLKKITDPATGVQDTSKIWLQVAMDSVQWKLADGKVINQTPYHPTYDAISARLAMGVEDFYPNYSYNPYARYHDDGDNTDNVLWYEDARSIKAKIELARLFGIEGISVWRLGNIPNESANYLNVWQTVTESVR